MKIIIILFVIFLSCLNSLAQADPIYKIRVSEQKTTHVEAVFSLASNKISMYMRGGTKELPKGEVEFVKNLTVKNSKNEPINFKYLTEGDWELENVAKSDIVKIDYNISNTHKEFDWQHTGGIDEVAFVTNDGLFYVGNSLFIIPDIEAQNIRVEFSLPIGWKASTAWEKNS
jgi:hypothetical protein